MPNTSSTSCTNPRATSSMTRAGTSFSPTFKELQACQFSSWYPIFRNLNNHIQGGGSGSGNSSSNRQYVYNNVTIRSIIIKPLPHDFIEYLRSDGIVLPKGARGVSSFLPAVDDDDDDSDINNNTCSDDDDSSCDWSTSSDGHDNCTSTHNPGDQPPNQQVRVQQKEKEIPTKQTSFSFPKLNQEIQKAIEKLGNQVIPKLNWSSPKDVTWINDGSTMKCSEVGDVYLLLKSSDFCMFDLNHALDGIDTTRTAKSSDSDSDSDHEHVEKIEYELILRKWSNLHQSMEFRCFVHNHELVGISQRNYSQHYPHLKREYMMIRTQIIDFFQNTIQHTYANNTVSNYVFDAYIDKNERVWLIDFNLWDERTDSLLFTWEEILQISNSSSSAVIEEKEEVKDNDKEAMERKDETENNEEKVHDDDDIKDEEEQELDNELINSINTKPEIRVVMNENEVLSDPLSSYRAPIDTAELASGNHFDSNAFQEFMAMCQAPSAMNDSDSDSESE